MPAADDGSKSPGESLNSSIVRSTTIAHSSEGRDQWIIPPSFRGVLSLIFLICLISSSTFASDQNVSEQKPKLDLVLGNYEELLEQRERFLSQPLDPESKISEMIQAANQVFGLPPVSVMQKTRVAPSGDRHDYLSEAPYFWADPESENGLPYIRRDGRVNPRARGNNVDYGAKEQLIRRVESLTMAGFYTGNPAYYRHAAEQLEVWFVNSDTRMNPNLNYAQGIPGADDGRCFGIIEWTDLRMLFTPIQILHHEGYLSETSYQSIRQWMKDFLDWLENSEFGERESTRHNNHGTWHDVQVLSLMIFFDRREDARKLINVTTKQRIAAQILPDGRQPQELARTKSLSYSQMNLDAFKTIASLAERVDIDLLNFETQDGRSIRGAEAFLEPYVGKQDKKKWPYQQIESNHE